MNTSTNILIKSCQRLTSPRPLWLITVRNQPEDVNFDCFSQACPLPALHPMNHILSVPLSRLTVMS